MLHTSNSMKNCTTQNVDNACTGWLFVAGAAFTGGSKSPLMFTHSPTPSAILSLPTALSPRILVLELKMETFCKCPHIYHNIHALKLSNSEIWALMQKMWVFNVPGISASARWSVIQEYNQLLYKRWLGIKFLAQCLAPAAAQSILISLSTTAPPLDECSAQEFIQPSLLLSGSTDLPRTARVFPQLLDFGPPHLWYSASLTVLLWLSKGRCAQ